MLSYTLSPITSPSFWHIHSLFLSLMSAVFLPTISPLSVPHVHSFLFAPTVANSFCRSCSITHSLSRSVVHSFSLSSAYPFFHSYSFSLVHSLLFMSPPSFSRSSTLALNFSVAHHLFLAHTLPYQILFFTAECQRRTSSTFRKNRFHCTKIFLHFSLYTWRTLTLTTAPFTKLIYSDNCKILANVFFSAGSHTARSVKWVHTVHFEFVHNTRLYDECS